MKNTVKLAMNRIMQPATTVSEFIRLAKECGFDAVELRNDLENSAVFGNESASDVAAAAAGSGVEILTINALQRFNDPALFEVKKDELEQLLIEADKVSCPMVILCPVNDLDDRRSANQQRSDLTAALKNYSPLFKKYAITGLIEPLGFSICSVRTKAQAVAAIKETGLSDTYKVTHDTFHHYLSGETELFPAETGLIHVSGVPAGKEKEEITDDDRILVTGQDCMDNRGQVSAMLENGYDGAISYEAFSPEVQKMKPGQLKNEIVASAEYLLG